jgi:hypothetical protein
MDRRPVDHARDVLAAAGFALAVVALATLGAALAGADDHTLRVLAVILAALGTPTLTAMALDIALRRRNNRSDDKT